MKVLNAYLDAQKDYASVDRDGDRVRQYAQPSSAQRASTMDCIRRPMLTRGRKRARSARSSRKARLTSRTCSQRPVPGLSLPHSHASGQECGRRCVHYVINGRMIAGFAMVAYPAQYGESGVMTFIVNQNGTIYQKDLGKDSADIAAKMTVFDPGPGWKEVAAP